MKISFAQKPFIDKRVLVFAVIMVLVFIMPVTPKIFAQTQLESEHFETITKNWKLYDDGERGLQIKYDPRWEMRLIENMAFFVISRTKNPFIMVSLYSKLVLDPTQTFREIVDAMLDAQPLFETRTYAEGSVGKYQSLMVSGESLRYAGTMTALFFIKKDNDLFVFTLTGVPEKEWQIYKEYFDAMLWTLTLQ